jgi:hypothetical protein
MNACNSWAEFAGLFCDTKEARANYEQRPENELRPLIGGCYGGRGHGIGQALKGRRGQSTLKSMS